MNENMKKELAETLGGATVVARAGFLPGNPLARVSVEDIRRLDSNGPDGRGIVRIGDGPAVTVDAEMYKSLPRYRGAVPEGDEELWQETSYTHFDVWANILLQEVVGEEE